MLAQFKLGDLIAMHLVRAIDNAQHAGARVSRGEAEVFGDTGARRAFCCAA